MATKSTRSSGTQINSRGITQGTTLVGPHSGLPIEEVVDSSGVRRLAVDANVQIDNVQVQVDLDVPDDGVHIGDKDTGYTLSIEPDGSINVNSEIDAADGDNIAISNGTNTLAVNPDGSINVAVTSSNPGLVKSNYNEITSVATSVLSTILTYTAPIGKVTYLQKVEFSGSNIAEYTILINAVVRDKKRTYFGSSLDTVSEFAIGGVGLPLTVGDIVTLKVIHLRPNVGDFNSRLQVIEI
jgi:hypothetical protein